MAQEVRTLTVMKIACSKKTVVVGDECIDMISG
jgi:hypothetical protein